MKPIFAVGDVHGEITLLDELLENWDKEQERLLFVGDLIDRGENPAAVLRRVKALADQTGAIVLKGNHEQMLLDFLENPSGKMHYYLSQGGMETIQSLIADSLDKKMTPEGLAERVKEEAAELIDFIRNLPLYYEEGKYVFVHAGVDLTKKIGTIPRSVIFSGFANLSYLDRIKPGKSLFSGIPRYKIYILMKILVFGFRKIKRGSI